MSLDEKIGQMITAAVVSNTERNTQFLKTTNYYAQPLYVQEMIKKFNIGGVLVIGDNIPEEHVALVNKLQADSKYPLLVLCDTSECNGLGMRMKKDITIYPKAMTLGALDPEDDELIYKLGLRIAKENQLLGIHCGLGPVCDVNNNPNNPIINVRSFGENPLLVAHKAKQFTKGLHEGNLLTCLKHWPGHGNTDKDSHKVLPKIKATKSNLEKVELLPFQKLINDNEGNYVDAIMTAHLDVPALTQQKELPISLSENAIAYLREHMGHKKLIITDGLEMHGITALHRHEDIAVQAICAGNDMLLCPVDIARAFCAIKIAIEKGIISPNTINDHVKRILEAKKRARIKKVVPFDMQTGKELTCAAAQELKKALYRGAITLARNNENRLPLTKKDEYILVITIAENSDTSKPFVAALQQHLKIIHHTVSTQPGSPGECNVIGQKAYKFDHVIVSLHIPSRSGMIEIEEKKIVPDYIKLINSLNAKATLILFGNPYNLTYLPQTGATIIAYENEPEAQEAAAEVLIGKYTPRGHLPVSTEGYPAGTSLRYENN
jgi:beta-glucosidase-like glycosyl hydrolase